MTTGTLMHITGVVERVAGEPDGPWTITIRHDVGRYIETVGFGTFYRRVQVGDYVDTVGFRDARGAVVRVKFNG